MDARTTKISSATKEVEIGRTKPTVIIGERINPTGRKAVLAALEAGDFDLIRDDAVNQVKAGSTVLDVNAGVPGANEVELLQFQKIIWVCFTHLELLGSSVKCMQRRHKCRATHP